MLNGWKTNLGVLIVIVGAIMNIAGLPDIAKYLTDGGLALIGYGIAHKTDRIRNELK